jgi:hypothetical protein
MLSGCRIRRNSAAEIAAGGEPYLMEFQSFGFQYACPLFQFQPRTQAVELVALEGNSAREAVAV